MIKISPSSQRNQHGPPSLEEKQRVTEGGGILGSERPVWTAWACELRGPRPGSWLSHASRCLGRASGPRRGRLSPDAHLVVVRVGEKMPTELPAWQGRGSGWVPSLDASLPCYGLSWLKNQDSPPPRGHAPHTHDAQTQATAAPRGRLGQAGALCHDVTQAGNSQGCVEPEECASEPRGHSCSLGRTMGRALCAAPAGSGGPIGLSRALRVQAEEMEVEARALSHPRPTFAVPVSESEDRPLPHDN